MKRTLRKMGFMSEVETRSDRVEEHHYRRGDIDICFILNRAHGHLRVFDYRVGNYQQKRDFFDRIARTEHLRKVFTVVEKQDSKSWRAVGFSREGAIPGYFRTADAYVMSRVYDDQGDPLPNAAPRVLTPAHVHRPAKAAKNKGVTTELVESAAKILELTEKLGREALYAPFRRRFFAPDLVMRGCETKREFWVGAELDSSFGHAKIDLMNPPTDESEVAPTAASLGALLDELDRREIASAFALCPVDWPLAGAVYAEQGFKVTARLVDHAARDDSFVELQVWHKRISLLAPPKAPPFI
jgi:hypothetical protein